VSVNFLNHIFESNSTCSSRKSSLLRCATTYCHIAEGVVFTFDVSKGGIRDGDVGVDCAGARKS